MATPALMISARYRLKGKPLGQGGMGVVYRAYDIVTKRDVALKTMRGALNPAALELFSKEWTVLARLSHPNIIDILDTGEFEQDGQRKPYFVMPLLPGSTLEDLIGNSSTRLTVARVVEIASQTCRGLQAAHERGLIHRDLKPSNIFVMDDDTVKIIDFGIVHLAGADSIKGVKGTLQYMAPEQIDMKPAAPTSDIFSLGVVCYQALTGRKPFSRTTEGETADAVRRHIPPPVCELNPLVSQIVSRVIHKAMAKDPWHRFSTAREYAETLQKALQGQPIERFERAKIQPRIDRAKKAQSEGDHQFASEILTELEAEGNIDPEMTLLRIQIDQAIRQKSIRQLLDSARTRLEEDEFPLALQKIEEVLGIDPDNADALGLRSEIEKQRSAQQTENWFRLVDQHLHNNAFSQARQALDQILKLNAKDNRAREILAEVDRREQEINRLRAEKEQLYQAAVSRYQDGEVSSALSKLERVLELNRQSPDSAIPERDQQYQSFYNQLRTERDDARNSYAEVRRYLSDRKFAKALELCAEFLKKSPGDPMFQALKLEAEEQQRQEQSSFIAEVARRVEAEPDLDRRVNILKEAAERYPDEPHFQQSLRLVRERRDLVNSIVARARQYEERSQFNEALGQFDILRNIYAQYPGIDFEVERLKRRRDEQVREEAKSRWVEQIDRHLSSGEYARALDLVHTAIAEFPNDAELAGLERLAAQALARAKEAEEWLQRGQKLCFDRQFGEGLEALRKAAAMDNRDLVIRAALLNALVEQARSVLGQDWRAAEPLIQQALSIDGGHPLAKSLQDLVLDYKRQEIVNECVAQVRELQVAGDLPAALAKVEAALASYPHEVRLIQLRSTLRNLGAANQSPPAPASPADNTSEPAKPSTVRASESSVQTEAFNPFATDPGRVTATDPPFTVDPSTAPIAPAAPPNSAERPGTAAPGFLRRVGNQLRSALVILRNRKVPEGHASPWLWWPIAAAPILILLALITTHHRAPPPPVSVPAEYSINFQANLPGAIFKIGTNEADLKLLSSNPQKLKPGNYTAMAFLPGYKAAPQPFSLSANSPKTLFFNLEPEKIHLKLASDLTSGKVSIDAQNAVDLENGGFSDLGISLSENHTLNVQSGKDSLSFSFIAEPGGIVNVLSRPAAKDIDAVLITNLAGHTHLYASNSWKTAAINPELPQPIPPEGLDWANLTGNKTLSLSDGTNQKDFEIDPGNAPALTVFLIADRSSANIQISCNVPDAIVMVNGRKRFTLHNRNGWTPLKPGTYKIYLVKEGYQPSAEQVLEVKKGDAPHLTFELNAIVRVSSLSIDDATPGATVSVDGAAIGMVSADGSLNSSDIQPGQHQVTFTKSDFENKGPITKTFEAGLTVHFSGVEGKLIPLGSLDFRVLPENAVITYGLEGQQPQTITNGSVRPVKQGRYQVTARSGQNHREETFVVAPGERIPVTWNLTPANARAIPVLKPPPPSDPIYFKDPGSWTKDGDFWVHNGSGVGWFAAKQGSYQIEISRPAKRGIRRRVPHTEWVIDQRDAGNRIDYTLDPSGLERKVFINGKAIPDAKPRDRTKLGSGQSYSLRIEIRQDRVVIESQGKELDSYSRPNPTAALGEFGFKGEVTLKIVSLGK